MYAHAQYHVLAVSTVIAFLDMIYLSSLISIAKSTQYLSNCKLLNIGKVAGPIFTKGALQFEAQGPQFEWGL